MLNDNFPAIDFVFISKVHRHFSLTHDDLHDFFFIPLEESKKCNKIADELSLEWGTTGKVFFFLVLSSAQKHQRMKCALKHFRPTAFDAKCDTVTFT